ncbi:arylamine N-acetyltransferase, partial [Bacillus thuringiensis]
MTSLQDQLFTRLNLKKRNDVTFEELPTILFSFAHTIPF